MRKFLDGIKVRIIQDKKCIEEEELERSSIKSFPKIGEIICIPGKGNFEIKDIQCDVYIDKPSSILEIHI